MQISFDTSTVDPRELNALAALIASLGGRLPAAEQAITVVNNVTAADLERVLKTDDLGARGVDAKYVVADGLAAAHAPVEGGKIAGPGSNMTTPDVELDADGIPWDERIHASTKTKTKQDVWTKKRNVDEVEYGRIHAELQEQYAAPLDASEEVPPPPATADTDQSSSATGTIAENAPTDDTDVPPPPAQDAPAGSNAEGSEGFKEFADLVAAVGKFNLPYTKLAELASMVSGGTVTKFPDLRHQPDLWSDFYDLAKPTA